MNTNWVVTKSSMVASTWVVAIATTGLAAGVESFTGWLMVSVLALGPSSILLHLSTEMPRTMSQEIQRAQR